MLPVDIYKGRFRKVFQCILILSLVSVLFSMEAFSQCLSGNCQNGTGVVRYPDSTRFEGTFANGQRASGTFYYRSGDRYEGPFTNNQRHGLGKYTYTNGDVFSGIYEEDQKVFGVYAYKNGDTYTGEFFQNKPHGFGAMQFTSGRKVEGEWENGLPAWKVAADSVAINNQATREPDFLAIKPRSVTPPKVYAVVVGISDYSGELSDLNYADDDARIFYRHLKKAFPKETANGAVSLLLDQNATKSNILNEMKRLFAKAGENDYVIFFFSGHGANGAFAPTDLYNSLRHDEVKSVFKQSNAKYRLCIADACYSGSIASGATPITNYQTAQGLRDTRLAVLLSSSSNETSAEMGTLRQGLFTYWLMRGLQGGADFNRDKYVTAGELFVYTRRAVILSSLGQQMPVAIGQQVNRIPLCRLK
jgi:hypothetical protein